MAQKQPVIIFVYNASDAQHHRSLLFIKQDRDGTLVSLGNRGNNFFYLFISEETEVLFFFLPLLPWTCN
jgi:hypothetical protein